MATRRSWVALGFALGTAVAFGACGGGHPGAAAADADAGDDAADDIVDSTIAMGDGETIDVFLGGGGESGIDPLSPDGCYRLGSFCTDDTTCCSDYCIDAACSGKPVHAVP